MINRLASAVLILMCVGALALGRFLPRWYRDEMPQVPGEDVLHLVLGDARQQLSFFMLGKADDYFHGGVKHEASEHGLAAEGTDPHDSTHEVDPSEGSDSQAHTHHDEMPVTPLIFKHDPWIWMNQRIHAQEHRHLKQERLVELLPWIWSACWTSPQNIQAFQVGSYVLARMTGYPEQGIRLLEEGVSHNPENPDLPFSLGEIWLNDRHDADKAEYWFSKALINCHPTEGEAGEEVRVLKVRALFYLGYLAKQRGDLTRARAYLAEAESVLPGHASVQDLRRVLKK